MENLDGWYVVDDGVMGGRSKGKLKIENGDTGVFSGKISLEKGLMKDSTLNRFNKGYVGV